MKREEESNRKIRKQSRPVCCWPRILTAEMHKLNNSSVLGCYWCPACFRMQMREVMKIVSGVGSDLGAWRKRMEVGNPGNFRVQKY